MDHPWNPVPPASLEDVLSSSLLVSTRQGWAGRQQAKGPQARDCVSSPLFSPMLLIIHLDPISSDHAPSKNALIPQHFLRSQVTSEDFAIFHSYDKWTEQGDHLIGSEAEVGREPIQSPKPARPRYPA